MDSIHIQGREYLGISGLVIGLCALRSETTVGLALAIYRVRSDDWF